MTASSTSSSSQTMIDPSAGPRSRVGWSRLHTVAKLWIALAICLSASLLTIFQSPRPDAFRSPRAFFSLDWWRCPLEWNAPSRLPKIDCSLHAIYADLKSNHVWAAGNQGMVVVSTDGGVTWEKRGIASGQIIGAAPAPSERPYPIFGPVENESLLYVHFDDADGEVITASAVDLKTGDGGKTWQYNPPPIYFDAFSLVVRDFPPDPGQLTRISPLDVADLKPVQSLYLGPDDRSCWIISRSGQLYRIGPERYGAPERSQPWGSDFRGVYFYKPTEGWAITKDGFAFFTDNRGINWDQVLHYDGSPTLTTVYFSDDDYGWIGGAGGFISATTNGGKYYSPDSARQWAGQNGGTHSDINAFYFSDRKHGCVAGSDGLILSTEDGGWTWVHRTQGKEAGGRYLRFPAPWYFLVLLITGLILLRQFEETTPPPEESVADVLVSDRPLDAPSGDVLAFNSIALGLSRFLRNENTLPPLTIAIIGEWGTGKSSLMNLLRADLRSYKFRPVWFNAWHHQKEEHMLASLLENIKLQAVPRWWTNRGLVFRARLLKIRG